MHAKKLSRRRFVVGSAATVGFMSAPYLRRANAAGSLTIGLWDHWVPGANDTQSAIVKEWADKEKVEVKIDYITSQGNKLLLTLAAESQASRRRHYGVHRLGVAQFNETLEPVDDIIKSVIAKNGPIDPAVEYLESSTASGSACR